MPKIDPEACPELTGTRYPEPFRAPVKDRVWRAIGEAAGLKDFGANLVTLRPGVWSSQRHWHYEDDELLVMLEGELVLIEDAGRTILRAGDIAAWPKASRDGHHVINESEAEARFLVVGANKGGAAYPAIDLAYRKGEKFFRHDDGKPYRVWERDE
ncbi:putative cupin superfamily protein [Sphingomonas vulcanisoli]|uniref:Cupin superfamily protein n=1 Tax=Sphingomonas vulcanisoli TaxID=1658060 RepID=A0ABX0TUZ3_9SPHN|nr:cupin domain-containing protein [Sphingomonas vulcanisoli]NIJ08202.1 putative cupin superfamily protein [Sphingomonas vulcanisoli]